MLCVPKPYKPECRLRNGFASKSTGKMQDFHCEGKGAHEQ